MCVFAVEKQFLYAKYAQSVRAQVVGLGLHKLRGNLLLLASAYLLET